ncbi:MAG: hypothetical protein U0P45_02130 [Acidimicrobiales bacterium]
MAPPGPATSATLDAAILDRCRRPAVDADERAAAAAALERWAGGRPTGQIQLDAEGRCTSLDLDDLAGLEELDLDIPRGAPFRTLLDQLEAELGASTWVAGEDLTGPIGDHHLWLTTGGDQRDKVGLRLRILACPVGDGADLLVATDTYLAPRATPVAVRARTADP